MRKDLFVNPCLVSLYFLLFPFGCAEASLPYYSAQSPSSEVTDQVSKTAARCAQIEYLSVVWTISCMHSACLVTLYL